MEQSPFDKSNKNKEEILAAYMKDLRARAERMLKPAINRDFAEMSSHDISRLVHELETHQIELEMQNKELLMTQEVLFEVRNEYCQLYDSAPVGYLTMSEKGLIEKANETFVEMLGVHKSNLSQKRLSAYIHNEDQDIFYMHISELLESQKKQSCELRLKLPSGATIWVRIDSICALKSANDECYQVRSVLIDISDRKLAEEQLSKLSLAVESSPSAVYITNAEGDIEYINPKFTDITGYSREEVMGQNPRMLQSGSTPEPVYEDLWKTINSGKSWYGKIQNRKKNGRLYWARDSISCVKNSQGVTTHFVAIQDDVTHEKALTEQLSYQASHDNLTGLINRYEFERRIDNLLSSIHSDGYEHALCFMDLDQFKIINDSCGHLAGDDLLRQLGRLLQKTVRHHDTLGRLGGDEFGVILQDCSMQQAHRIANSILQMVQDFSFQWEGRRHQVGISIGLVEISKFSTLKELLMRADAACYSAKDQGRNRIQEYQVEDTEMALRHGEMRWVARINQALKEDRFQLYAQAITPSVGGNSKHFELLIRMIDENGNKILPGEFIPAAEHYNLIENLDSWVINHIFSILSLHTDFTDQIECISINLSGPSISNKKFQQNIISLFESSNVPAQKICFEITETVAISNLSAAIKFISTLKKLGCSFALDDFGSGLSSFGYLKNLPVDYLKIDGMFVKQIAHNDFDLTVVKSINEISQVLQMQTIAEFVETDEIKEILKSIGINYLQGNGISKPVPIENLIQTYQKPDH